jgi:pilus assembly protein CpaC
MLLLKCLKRTTWSSFTTLIVLLACAQGSIAQDSGRGYGTRPAPVRLSEKTNPAHGKTVQTIDIQKGKASILETSFSVTRVAVGDPEVADFYAISDREIRILANEIGDTNIILWGRNRLEAVIDIHVAGLQPHVIRELSRLLDNPDISVDVAGGSIILRGTVPTLQAFEQAELLANAFLSRGQEEIAGQDPVEKPEVINLLSVGGGHQVMIEVVIAELRRNFRRSMGVNMAGQFNSSGGNASTFQTMLRNLSSTPGLGSSGTGAAGASSLAESVTLAGSFFSSSGTDLRLFLEAVEANQLGTILAEPTVVARSGESADFLVGGEVPIPIVTGLGGIGSAQYSIIFKKFGVNVEFTPTVLSPDRIHLQVTPEVSEPDFTFGVSVLGSAIPAFQTRRVNTSVELGDGESFVLAGLLREDVLADVENLPLLSDIPILGQLFSSRAFQKKQTELVLIVTPHLVQPMPPGTEFELPTDHYLEPTPFEFYWDGLIEGRQPKKPEEEKRDTVTSTSALSIPENPRMVETELDLDIEMASREGSPTSVGGFLGAFGHRLKTPQPVGDIQ